MKHSLTTLLSAAALGTFALSACSAGSVPGAAAVTTPVASAPAAPGEAAVRKAMNSVSKGIKVDSVRPSPVAGLMEVEAEGETAYVTIDGKYLITGNIIDVANKRNLTEASRAVARRGVIRNLTPSQMIVFAPNHPKYTVTVFTDVDCGFCRKLHSQIADYNKAGIAVDYLFFPRTGIGSESYDKAVSVWCASDRRQAFTDAKKGMNVPKANCTNPVTMDYNLGLKVGVDGTPAIYAADGTQIGGYLSPADMRAKLDQLAVKPNS
jgi:thiol:disulfide interchange protein DsbC